jgi:hypothetical protein
MTGRLCFTCAAVLFASAALSIAQQRFDSPETAAKAIINAANDHDSAEIMRVLGPNAREILSSGNPGQDHAEQDEFVREASGKHRIEISSLDKNRAILSIGDEDWPFPVPLVRKDGKWSFDASEAPVEMHARKIGANELDAIEICRGYADAQHSYAGGDHSEDGMRAFAAHLKVLGEQSLIPEGLAQAEWEGAVKGQAKPYHGYFFRVLDRQGPNAHGGEHQYVVKQKLIGGFGLVAWPAEYGVTGIHTFIVNQDGMVYEKDIAPVPARAIQVSSFDPDHSWQEVD